MPPSIHKYFKNTKKELSMLTKELKNKKLSLNFLDVESSTFGKYHQIIPIILIIPPAHRGILTLTFLLIATNRIDIKIQRAPLEALV